MRRVLVVLLALGLAVLVGCAGPPPHGPPSLIGPDLVQDGRPPTLTPVEPPVVTGPPLGLATDALDTLLIKGRAPMTGYDRAEFGPAWADVDRTGCDQRNDALARDLDGETFKPGTHDCVVLTGTLHDPYTGKVIPFTRGRTTSDDVQIDHVVPLADAWQKGAQLLDDGQRLYLANSLINLQATEGVINQRKGAGDAATWLPPAKDFRCRYIATQIAVKVTWHLWVSQAEHDAMRDVLATCPEQELPQ